MGREEEREGEIRRRRPDNTDDEFLSEAPLTPKTPKVRTVRGFVFIRRLLVEATSAELLRGCLWDGVASRFLRVLMMS